MSSCSRPPHARHSLPNTHTHQFSVTALIAAYKSGGHGAALTYLRKYRIEICDFGAGQPAPAARLGANAALQGPNAMLNAPLPPVFGSVPESFSGWWRLWSSRSFGWGTVAL